MRQPDNPSARKFQQWEAEYAGDPEYITHGLLNEVTEAICRALIDEGIAPEAVVTELAARMGISKWRVKRFLNTPLNTTLLEIVRFAQAGGFTVEINLTQKRRN